MAALAPVLAGCAGATLGSGVGDTRLERAPYYAGHRPVDVGTVAYVPVAYQPGASQPAIFDPRDEEGTAVAALLEALNRTLTKLAGRAGAVPAAPPVGTPPDVQFGCDLDVTDGCLPRDEGELMTKGNPSMRLAVGRPSAGWVEGAASALDAAGADALLVVTLEVGQYWPRQTSWRGTKEVELGTGHAVSLPWLTSLETPVSVLQLTGALVGRDGKVIRIGAEGLRARRTPIILAGFGAQELITEADVRELMAARREDLPARPPVWEAALEALVAELVPGS